MLPWRQVPPLEHGGLQSGLKAEIELDFNDFLAIFVYCKCVLTMIMEMSEAPTLRLKSQNNNNTHNRQRNRGCYQFNKQSK